MSQSSAVCAMTGDPAFPKPPPESVVASPSARRCVTNISCGVIASAPPLSMIQSCTGLQDLDGDRGIRQSEQEKMSIASAPRPVESAPVATDNGMLAPETSVPMTIPDDMLYEVVEGKLVEKTVGARDIEIAGILGPVSRACLSGRTDSGSVV